MSAFRIELEQYATRFPEGFRARISKLEAHFGLLQEWNERAGLVSPKSLLVAGSKHYFDSAQIAYFCFAHLKGRPLYDLGSGGGFPGVISAILGKHETVLYERSLKKRNFLLLCQRELGLDNMRVEGEFLKKPGFPVLMSARAVSPLPELLKLLAKRLNPGSSVVYPGTQLPTDPAQPFRRGPTLEYQLPTEGERRSLSLFDLLRVFHVEHSRNQENRKTAFRAALLLTQDIELLNFCIPFGL